jgi:hypothetical protein
LYIGEWQQRRAFLADGCCHMQPKRFDCQAEMKFFIFVKLADRSLEPLY